MLNWLKRSNAHKAPPFVANAAPPRRELNPGLRKGLESLGLTDDLLRPVLPPMSVPPALGPPGDLSRFAPYGNGCYGHQAGVGAHSITGAPIHEAAGGVVYFDSGSSRDHFASLLKLLHVDEDDTDFAIFARESEAPMKDRYLTQIRIASKFALNRLYQSIDEAEYDAFTDQEISLGDTLWKFIADQEERWGTSFRDSKGLDGKFGGDGDMARESLAFGFMVENSYFGIYRIWSRAWLVTK